MWIVALLLCLSAFFKIEILGAYLVPLELILAFSSQFGRYTISYWVSRNMWHSIASPDLHVPGVCVLLHCARGLAYWAICAPNWQIFGEAIHLEKFKAPSRFACRRSQTTYAACFILSPSEIYAWFLGRWYWCENLEEPFPKWLKHHALQLTYKTRRRCINQDLRVQQEAVSGWFPS